MTGHPMRSNLKKVLKVKNPASEGKYDASGASTFRATGDHFWIAVAWFCKKDANSLDLLLKFDVVTAA